VSQEQYAFVLARPLPFGRLNQSAFALGGIGISNRVRMAGCDMRLLLAGGAAGALASLVSMLLFMASCSCLMPHAGNVFAGMTVASSPFFGLGASELAPHIIKASTPPLRLISSSICLGVGSSSDSEMFQTNACIESASQLLC
jgi:hypothetical protein